MAADFRYEMPDGSTVEAFQMHEGSRYQQSNWPEWMDSKMLMTKQSAGGKNTHWLVIGESETEIPDYGWIMRKPDGRIVTVPYEVMELAKKVVREIPKIPDPLKPQPEAALRLAAKITKRSYEDVKAEDEAQVRESNRRRQELIDSLMPEDAAALGLQQTSEHGPPVEPDRLALEKTEAVRNTEPSLTVSTGPTDIILELCDAYEDLADGKVDEARVKFRNILSQRVAWCNCPPGQCAGLDPLICRTNSPLTR